jgi:hypothetical protein
MYIYLLVVLCSLKLALSSIRRQGTRGHCRSYYTPFQYKLFPFSSPDVQDPTLFAIIASHHCKPICDVLFDMRSPIPSTMVSRSVYSEALASARIIMTAYLSSHHLPVPHKTGRGIEIKDRARPHSMPKSQQLAFCSGAYKVHFPPEPAIRVSCA